MVLRNTEWQKIEAGMELALSSRSIDLDIKIGIWIVMRLKTTLQKLAEFCALSISLIFLKFSAHICL